MKYYLIFILLTGQFSTIVFGRTIPVLLKDTVSTHETALKISQTQLDELYQLSSYGINLIKDNLINHGTFKPVVFSYSNTKDLKVITYDNPGIKDSLVNDFAYEKLIRTTDQILKEENIRIVSIVYKDNIKSDRYPNGNDCITLLFIGKEFDNSVLESFPVRILEGKLMFEDVIIQIVKK